MKNAEEKALVFLESRGIEHIGQLAVNRSLRDVALLMEQYARETAMALIKHIDNEAGIDTNYVRYDDIYDEWYTNYKGHRQIEDRSGDISFNDGLD